MSGPTRTCQRRLLETRRAYSVFDGEPCQTGLGYSPFTFERHIDGLTVYVSTDYEYHRDMMDRIVISITVVWIALVIGSPPVAAQNASPAGSSDAPLGDIAKKVRPTNAKVTSKRVYTDDDVVHGQPVGADSDTKARTSSAISRAESVVNDLADLNSRELGENVVGDVRFPGREVWENKLYAQKQKLVAAARAWLATQKDGSGPGVADAAANSYNVQRTMYNDLEMEGKAQADSWKNRRNDGAVH